MVRCRIGSVLGALAVVLTSCSGSDGPAATNAATESTAGVATTLPPGSTTAAPEPTAATTVPATSGLPSTTLPPTTEATASSTTTSGVPTAPDAASVLLPASIAVRSMSWPTADDGWVLGSASDGGAPQLLHTSDAGATWTAVTGVDTTAFEQVVFAGPDDGWIAADDGLRSTHDGGATWTDVAVTSDLDSVPAVAAANGVVHIAYLAPSVGGIGIASSPVDHDAFVPSSLVLPFGAGPAMGVVMTAGGPYAALVYLDRTLTGAAELRDGEWVSWDIPCPDAGAPIALAGLSPHGEALSLACGPSGYADPAPIVGADLTGGDIDWVEIEPAGDGSTAMPYLTAVAATDVGTRLAVFTSGGGRVIAASTDGGATWSARTSLPDGTSGTVLAHLPDGSLLLATSPAGGLASADGLTWAPVGTSAVAG